MAKIKLQSENVVAETLLIPLYFRAKETQRPDALVKDEQAVALVKQLDYDFSRIKLRKHDEVAIILRVREFDRFARGFLNRCPDGVVVHIGCGLDTRFQRVAEGGRVDWYDLDLPEVVDLRRKLIGGEGEHYHNDAPYSGHPESIRNLPLPAGRSRGPGCLRQNPIFRMRRRAEARNGKLPKLHFFEVPELEGALAQAGFEGFEPLVYGGVIIFRARKAK